MAVEKIDPNIQGLISRARIDAQKNIDKDDASDIARKSAEKKLLQKKKYLKSNVITEENLESNEKKLEQISKILKGSEGSDVANALHDFETNQKLQNKLTAHQKESFYNQVLKNPNKAAKIAKSLQNLSQKNGFDKSINNSQSMNSLLKGLQKNPKAKDLVAHALDNPFMKTANTEPKVNHKFLEFSMRQDQENPLKLIQKTGDMLYGLNKNNMGASLEIKALDMAMQKNASIESMDNIDSFLSHQDVKKLPNLAKRKATSLLLKSNGKKDIKRGFEKLSSDQTFKKQNIYNKEQFFSTIEYGKPSNFRPLTNKLLMSLQDKDFPHHSKQVTKFLNKISKQVQKSGLLGVDIQESIRYAKISDVPKLALLSSVNMNDINIVAQNRAYILKHYNQIEGILNKAEKELNRAKYFEDTNKLSLLRDIEMPDSSSLSLEEQEYLIQRHQSVKKKLALVRKLQQQKARELKRRRISPAKQRLREENRFNGKQKKYFTPSLSTSFKDEASPQLNAVNSKIYLDDKTDKNNIEKTVHNALKNLDTQSLNTNKLQKLIKNISEEVTKEVMQKVSQELLSGTKLTQKKRSRIQKGKIDDWGIPRTFERDLGAANSIPVNPVSAKEDDLDSYKGHVLVKDSSNIRSLDDCYINSWKKLSRSESALLRNLGWNQQIWDSKDSNKAQLPIAMRRSYINLSPIQRESVRKLGFTSYDWDKRIQAFSMGKNA